MRNGSRGPSRDAVTAHVDSDSWVALLDRVAVGDAEVVIKTATSARAVLVSESYLEELRRRASDGAERGGDQSPLSPRELEVLSLAAEGHTGVAIADRLGLAVNTVAQHLVSARRKLGVRTTRAAVDLARSAGDLH